MGSRVSSASTISRTEIGSRRPLRGWLDQGRAAMQELVHRRAGHRRALAREPLRDDAAPVPEPKPADADEAVAIKAAIDASDLARAQSPMTILVESQPDRLPPRPRMAPGRR